MIKVDALHAQFTEAIGLPDQRRTASRIECNKLKVETAAAKKAFESAEVEGIESGVLFDNWQALEGKLKLAEARAEVLAKAQPGAKAEQAARQLVIACHAEVESLQSEKRSLEAPLLKLKSEYMEHVSEYLKLQERQVELAGLVTEARELVPNERPVMLRQVFKDMRDFAIGEELLQQTYGYNNRAAFGSFRQVQEKQADGQSNDQHQPSS